MELREALDRTLLIIINLYRSSVKIVRSFEAS
jgi:hypothetical protein